MSSGASHRERVYSVFAGDEEATPAKIDDALAIGSDYLGLEFGFLTRIEDGVQRITQSTGSHDLLRAGETCPLEEAYCRRTVEADGAVSVQHAGDDESIPPAAVDRFGLGAYIGAKVRVDDELYGTVCFADTACRDEPFPERDAMFVELIATLVGQALEQQAYQEELLRRNDRLDAERKRFERIADASSDILFRLDADAEITYLSSAAERVLGYPPASLVGRSFTALIDDGAAEAALDAYEDVMDGDTVEGVELDFQTAAGDRVTLEVNAVPTEFEEGTRRSVQGVARDVTPRKERERELRLKDRAIETANLGIVIADTTRPDNPLTYVNEAFCEQTGYDPDTVLGRNCRFLQGPLTDDEPVATLRERIDEEEPVSVELVNYRADGSAFWNELSLTPVENPAGETTRFIGFQRDITVRKRRERLLGVLNRVLRHNLRNEMTVIRGAVGAFDDGDERVTAAADRLLDIARTARELYQFAQAEPDPKRLDPATLFEDALDDIAVGPEVTVDRRVDASSDICAGGELRAAVAELVDNAVEHDPASETHVGLTARQAGDEVVVTVADDGPGIEEMEARVVNTGVETPTAHGGGLDLWSINWIVTLYGGSFRLETREEAGVSGTIATIRLPAVGADESVAAVARRPTLLAA